MKFFLLGSINSITKLIIFLTQRNCGIRTNISFVDNFLSVGFITFRAVLLIVSYYWTIPMTITFIFDTWKLNNANYWKNK